MAGDVMKWRIGHHPVDGERHLLADLVERQLRHPRVAAPLLVEQENGADDIVPHRLHFAAQIIHSLRQRLPCRDLLENDVLQG